MTARRGGRQSWRGPGGRHDERGAVAVLTAILVSGVLLVVGALAVDLGALWAARAGLTGVAQSAALAGAAQLPQDPRQAPDVAAVVAAAVGQMCAAGNVRDGWATACAGGTAWATNDDAADGEVTIGRSEAYPALADPPWVVTVVTPPVDVEFGLARAAGVEKGTPNGIAGARRGLPYPADSAMAQQGGPLWAGSPYSPYYLTLEDLQANRNNPLRALCLRTVGVSATSSLPPPPTPTAGFLLGGWAVDGSGNVVDDTDGNGNPDLQDSNARSFTVTGAQLGTVVPPAVVDPATVSVYVGVQDAAHLARTDDVEPDASGTAWQIKFTTPDLRATPLFGPVPVWFVYDDGTTTGTSDPLDLDYPAPTGTASGDCDPVRTGRGVVDAAALAPGDSVRQAVAGGLATALVPFGSRPQAQALPQTDQACDAPTVAGLAVPAEPGDPSPGGANCVPLRAAPNPTALTNGWLSTDPDAPGRLAAASCGETGTITGLPGTFDQSNLFNRANGLVTGSVNTFDLRSRIRAGLAANADLARQITPKVFDCPRLLLVPVIDATPPADATKRYAVAGFTYFWVSDIRTRDSRGRPLRGLMVTPSLQVVGIRGWVVDPAYVQGGDWAPRDGDPDTVLPVSVPRSAVLVRTPCDGHPDSPVCAP